MTPQQVNTVTLDRKEYDSMREDLRVFNAGAVRVLRKHGPDSGYYAVEVGDVPAFVGAEVSKELEAMRGLRTAERGQPTPANGVPPLLAGVLLGATAASILWWAIL